MKKRRGEGREDGRERVCYIEYGIWILPCEADNFFELLIINAWNSPDVPNVDACCLKLT